MYVGVQFKEGMQLFLMCLIIAIYFTKCKLGYGY